MRKFFLTLVLITLCSGTVWLQDEPAPTKTNKRPVGSETKPEPFDSATKAEMKKCVTFDTTQGSIVLEMFPFTAPETVRNFLNLTAIKAYDGSFFNRVVPGFVIQGGNLFAVQGVDQALLERSLKKIPDEPNQVKHTRGILSMARGEEPNSASSDFFILLRDASTLDEKFAAFGRVTEGMSVVEVINKMPVKDEIPENPVAILKTSIGACVVKPEDGTKIDDRPRFGLRGNLRELKITNFLTNGNEKNWKKKKMTRKGYLEMKFGPNGNLEKQSFLDQDGKVQRIRTSVGTIFGERADGTVEYTDKDSEGQTLEVTKQKRTSKIGYNYETFGANNVLKIRGQVLIDENGKKKLQTIVRMNSDGTIKSTLKKSITYDPYGFVSTETIVDDEDKEDSFFRYDYRDFDQFGNWIERWVFDSKDAKKPVRVEKRTLTYAV